MTQESPSKAVPPSGNIRNATAVFSSLSKSMTPPLHTQTIPVNCPENPKKLLPKIRHCWQYFPPPQTPTITAASARQGNLHPLHRWTDHGTLGPRHYSETSDVSAFRQREQETSESSPSRRVKLQRVVMGLVSTAPTSSIPDPWTTK